MATIQWGYLYEVYCINQDWETPDDNSSYDGEILNPTDIRDYLHQTVYVDAQQNEDTGEFNSTYMFTQLSLLSHDF